MSKHEQSAASGSGADSTSPSGDVPRRAGSKANVSSACAPCKRAHLACDVARPCKRCVNIGKEEQCEDVPHKKRGRPKVLKIGSNGDSQRKQPSMADGGGRWRGPPATDIPYMISTEPMPPQAPPVSHRTLSPPRRPPSDAASRPELFEVFTNCEFKILRATPACYHLTGFHPHEYLNVPLIEWVHPADRHRMDALRQLLVNVPFAGRLQTDRETEAAVTQVPEQDLLSPAEGMRDYPAATVRVLRADQSFGWFNLRLHLGGGLGASLWRTESLGKVYLVVSVLSMPNYIPEPHDTARRLTHPPAPTSSVHPSSAPAPPSGQPPQPLPSFSSFAAAANVRDSSANYPTPGPSRSSPPPQQQPPTHYFPRPPPTTARRSSSPPHRSSTAKYAQYPPAHPSYYPEQNRPTPPATADQHPRPSGAGADGAYRQQRAGQHPPPPGQPGPGADYGRRTWEL